MHRSKDRYLDHLRGTPRATRLVSACDKVHNLTNIVADLRAEGLGFLDRFNAGPEELVWYYRGARGALGDDLPAALLSSFDAMLDELETRGLPTATIAADKTA